MTTSKSMKGKLVVSLVVSGCVWSNHDRKSPWTTLAT